MEVHCSAQAQALLASETVDEQALHASKMPSRREGEEIPRARRDNILFKMGGRQLTWTNQTQSLGGVNTIM